VITPACQVVALKRGIIVPVYTASVKDDFALFFGLLYLEVFNTNRLPGKEGRYSWGFNLN
jgi:hypothetical protein